MTSTTKRRREGVARALQKYFLSALTGYHTDTTRHVTTSDEHYNTPPLLSSPHTHYAGVHSHTRKPLIFWVLIMNDAADMCVIPVIVACDTYVVPMYDTATVILIIIIIIIIIFRRRTNTCCYLRDKRVICLLGISVYNYTNISCSASDDYVAIAYK